jgi:gamma-glutamyltranspeptidase / glutathione hydrolase
LQEAVDAPRARHLQGLEVYLENGIPEEVAAALQGKGHQVIQENPTTNQVGGGQAIYLDHTENVLLGASDRRKDGCVLGY